jgi:hypothetical protein
MQCYPRNRSRDGPRVNECITKSVIFGRVYLLMRSPRSSWGASAPAHWQAAFSAACPLDSRPGSESSPPANTEESAWIQRSMADRMREGGTRMGGTACGLRHRMQRVGQTQLVCSDMNRNLNGTQSWSWSDGPNPATVGGDIRVRTCTKVAHVAENRCSFRLSFPWLCHDGE